MVSYCFDTPEAAYRSFMRHKADRYLLCVRYLISLEGVVQDRKSPTRLLSRTTETQRKVESSKQVAGMVRGRVQTGKRRWAVTEILNLSERSPTERPSFLKNMC